jgi:hypothetical protein
MLAVPTKFDPKGLPIEVRGYSQGGDAAFDSYVKRKDTGTENHTLTLALKVFLRPVSPPSLQLQLDHDLKPFVIEQWPPGELAAYKKLFEADAARWNNRFWLIPPAGYTGFDVKVGNRVMRPNVYCHLYVAAMDDASNAHCTVDVVYLQKAFTNALGKVTNTKPTGGTFRSNDRLLDSLDGIPYQVHAKFRTIPHEIGHMLGLPHIGRDSPACAVAILLATAPNAPFAGVLTGGHGSAACYVGTAPGNATNVMGGGSDFSKENAKPWLDRIAIHTNTQPHLWSVALQKPSPKAVV